MKRIKQFADKAFVRPDRTEVLSEGLQEAERRIDQIKLACESIVKKVQGCIQGQGKDGVSIEKRIRKVPEFMLGGAMVTSSKNLGDNSVFGEVLNEGGNIEMKLAQTVVEFEIKIDECVLKPLHGILEHDLPNIYKLKKQLQKQTETMDAAKAKVQQASRHSMSGGSAGKVDNIKDEWEDAQIKVEQCRDNLAAEMYALLARESEISRIIRDFLNFQKEYHQSVLDILTELVPNVDAVISSSVHKPVYGTDLVEHLKTTKSKIAYPIELCVCGLLETGLDEEGLFRIAGSTSKVKKLKSAFDAGILDLAGLLREFGDPHVIATALKCYFRDLPEPLLTYDLYDDWMKAITVPDGKEKLQALWTVVQKLRSPYLENLAYLVKFLKELCNHQHVNKMSTANIAIVMGPNLMRSKAKTEDLTGDNSQMGLNMTMTHHYSSVLDQLISYCDYFFPEDIDFYVTCEKPVEDLTANRGSGNLSNGLSGAPIEESTEPVENSSNMKRSQSTSSVDDHSPPQGSPKPVLRRKNKPAPVPPSQPHKTSPIPQQRDNSTEKEFTSGGAQLTKTNSFKNRNSQLHITETGKQVMSPTIEKEKREGIWIPPSPSQLANRKNAGQEGVSGTGVESRPLSVYPPPKPPQPQFDQNRLSKYNLPVQPNEPPPKPSPLKYKTSFKSSSSMDSPTSTNSSPGDHHASPSRHNTTDNIDSSTANNTFANSANQFSSLPRHFNSKNNEKGPRAVRPPSIFSVPPNVPPPQPPTAPVSLPPSSSSVPSKPEQDTQEDQKGSDIQIGFEKLENEVRKSSSDKSGEESSDEIMKLTGSSDQASNNNNNNNNNNNTSKPEPIPGSQAPNPPVPAPRSSLHLGGSGSSPPTVTKDGQAPLAKERPSLMAKPRDIPKRTQSQNKGVIGNSTTSAINTNVQPRFNEDHPGQGHGGGGGESENLDGSNTSQSNASEGSIGSHDESTEVCRNGGPKSLPLNQQAPLSPTSRVPYRPPRPHPPPPPKVRPAPGESTDL